MKTRIKSLLSCHCGSKLGHLFDLERLGHYTICNRKQHEKYIAKPYAPTLFDFFCECGGVYIPTTNYIRISEGVELMREFVCPACTTRWRFMGPPEGEGAKMSTNRSIVLALSHASLIVEQLQTNTQIVECISILRSYARAPAQFPLETFFRNVFKTFKEPLVPPANMPERKQFKAWVAALKIEFSDILKEEAEAGLYVW